MNHETSNPFDDDNLDFLVLVNAQRQYSLWPAFAAVPAGWERVRGPEPRATCVAFLEAHWTDIRPQPAH